MRCSRPPGSSTSASQKGSSTSASVENDTTKRLTSETLSNRRHHEGGRGGSAVDESRRETKQGTRRIGTRVSRHIFQNMLVYQ